MRLNKHYSTKVSTLRRSLNARRWCAFVALLTALTFIALVCTAVTHYHGTTQETQDCSICAVVADKIGSASTPGALVAAQLFVLVSVLAASLHSAAYANSERLPPSCGPPDHN